MSKITMLGTGFISRFYTMSLHGNRSRDQVHVIYSRSEERGQQFAQDCSVPKWTTDMAEAITDPETEVVVIGLPNNLHEEAAILAARVGRASIGMTELEEAALKVKLGPEKKMKQTEADLKMTAYHEAGHAVVTHLLPKMDPVHRISIVARGASLGHTLIPPKTDRYTYTKTFLLNQITSLLGGRAAEKMIFDELTGGAANDISKVSELARNMVLKMGMSSLGPINLGGGVDVGALGTEWYEPMKISESLQSKADQEIKKIVGECEDKAMEILKKNKGKLDKVAKALLEKETLESEDFEKLMV